MSVTDELVSYMEGLKYEDLPVSVVEIVKRSVLNILSAAMAGSSAGVTSNLVNIVKEWGGRPEGTIFVYGDKVPLPNAAWVNSALVRGFDFDDVYEVEGYEAGVHQVVGHVNATIIPAALAISEYSQAFKNKVINGRNLIVAIAFGNELTCRLKLAGKIQGRGWGVEPFATLGVAGLGAKLLGLSKDKTHNALGIAYWQCSGNSGATTGEGTGSMPSLGQGLGTKAGVLSVLLADKGFTAAKEILDGRCGLYSLYGLGGYEPKLLLGELGKRYESVNLTTKSFPGCGIMQDTISAALKLVQDYNVTTEDIAKITLKMIGHTYTVLGEGKGRPSSAADALWNYPYTIAVALAKGKVSVDDFTEDAIRDAKVLELLQKVTVEVSPTEQLPGEPGKAAEIEIKTKSGKSYTKAGVNPKGHFKNPMSADELAEKLKTCNRFSAKPLLAESVERLIQTINKLEDIVNVTEITNYWAKE